MGIISYLTFLALESTQGPEGAPDGKDLAISGLHVFLGSQGLVLITRFSLGINSYLTILALESTQMAKFWPFPAPTLSEMVVTKTKIYQN